VRELEEVRATLARALGLVDGLLSRPDQQPRSSTSADKWRRRPNGPLNEAGEAEARKLIAQGCTNSELASRLVISLAGAAKLRTRLRKEGV
jgi:hypothetical protein